MRGSQTPEDLVSGGKFSCFSYDNMTDARDDNLEHSMCMSRTESASIDPVQYLSGQSACSVGFNQIQLLYWGSWTHECMD